ncbi:nucleotidyltransferase family protein [Litoreibacter janthinus]|uniref:Nucleotidyl transferase n=1 Tax=Litoreibacter janthinus TaxID=670154 RepID=A0A1I6FUX7_9RHOB|nr:sugar phosphate nucleotidyltransferase [Litoreibacter janthinus]SFR33721.1 Nucleotidyl transferase [Litoreibacter janthinus]
MRAIVLAGGEGKRLRPYTHVLPKPLMPVGGRPILEIIVGQLKAAGFDDLTFAVGYLASIIQTYFHDGSRFGVKIGYSMEEKKLGTAGPLGLIKDRPTDPFLVMNGDILTNIDYAAFMEAHKASGALATLAVFPKAVPISLGVLELDDADNITGYIEKPTLHYPVSTGMYCFNPRIFDFIPENEYLDLPDLVLKLIAAGETVRGFNFDDQWLDIGRPSDYEAAEELFAKVKTD